MSCIRVRNGSDAEVSAVENMIREDMHPGDQCAAFASFYGEGESVADVAVRFGVSERLVRQRMRLGGLAPVLLDQAREGAIAFAEVVAGSRELGRQRQRL